MELRLLVTNQVGKLYKEHMVFDFPKDELKPLAMILKAIDEDRYEPLGLFDGEGLIGYVFVVKLGNDYLVDYLATFPEYRNKGKGANLLGLLDEYLKDANSIIGEVEDPLYTLDEEVAALQERRINFYKRNGCKDTGVRVECFGVKYIVLETGKGKGHSTEEVWQLYESFYRSLLPEDKFIKNIKRETI